MHNFIEYIFYNVWCKAPSTQYGITLFEGLPELYMIMGELFKKELAEQLKGSGAFFYESVNAIFDQFKNLDAGEIQQMKDAFAANNNIEQACLDVQHPITVYDSFIVKNKPLVDEIKSFFKEIYSSGFWNLKVVEKTIGSTLGDYYNDFVEINEQGVCPFCGILPMDSEHDPTREAFDHYLPKSKYPFNSVNLKNLAPSCHKCNSGNKRDKDPLIKGTQRRKAFYPFSSQSPDTEVTLTVVNKVWDRPLPENFSIEITSEAYPDEVETWKELFCIEKRYLAKCCSSLGYKPWLNRIFDESRNCKLTVAEILKEELRFAEKNPFSDAGFLRKSFLEACDKAGLFNYDTDVVVEPEPVIEGAA
ncbi:MAG: HNH endonuclease [Halodesulfovibrio sp.]|uniref:HNH endonuclease n=1 Tax=Halodesulfovibrio sp. TaxID=1912772 RepID=UPI00359EDF10